MADRSYRCSTCAINWPQEAIYKKCTKCGDDTYDSGSEPMDKAEAHSLSSHIEFERYCEKRDALRQQEIDELEASLK